MFGSLSYLLAKCLKHQFQLCLLLLVHCKYFAWQALQVFPPPLKILYEIQLPANRGTPVHLPKWSLRHGVQTLTSITS